jgi:hypothetical protein
VAKKVDDAESTAVLLRTSADVLSHALSQMDCCANRWPQYTTDASTMREMVERMVEHAKDYGYIEKRGRV